MAVTCPRCQSPWEEVGPCPSCGFEPEHPGVLGSIARGAGMLARSPVLLLPYLIPVGLLLLAQRALTGPLSRAQGNPVIEGIVLVVGLTIHLWWLLVAIGTTARARLRDDAVTWPSAAMVQACALAAGLVALPLSLLALAIQAEPTGALGAVAGLGGFALLVVVVVALGRSVGVPVQTTLTPGERALDQVRKGNGLARENGGLGFIFLFLLAVGTVVFLQAVASVAGVLPAGSLASQSASLGLLWLLEAMLGASVAHGLVLRSSRSTTFTCPRCGSEAVAQGGRARCTCGLAGPFYPGAAQR
ncbi:MAG: hypothetical protein R3185_01225 [Candidatus Thermoplasmatota archaeon]|nr:hypothetical protein [Candidatus Thermoplasmatota archaeon]